MKQYLIAHDIGTSGTKASLFSVEGELIRSNTVSYETHFFNGNCAEQNPQDWWKAVCESTHSITAGINPADVLAISFSAQMQCCLVVDKEGNPLRPAMIWADQRAQEEAERLKKVVGFDEMYEITGHRVSASYSLEKLMWIKKHEPENYSRTYRMLQVKDYIIFRLTGRFVTDYSDASGTNALDLKNMCWSQSIIEASEVDKEMLPKLIPSTEIVGNLTILAAHSLGLTTGTTVVCGGGDGPCSALGAGCIQPNEMFLSFGTSAWIGGTTDEMYVDKDKVLFCFAHVIPGKYMPCGTMQSAGSAYSYIKKTICESNATYEDINKMAEASPPGAKNLIFLPYLLGERSPRWNPDASGSFLGIRMDHKKEDYIRAVLEGVAMNLELILSSYRRNISIEQLVLTGGGAKGDITVQILADILKVRLNRVDYAEEATSIAAATIAGVGIGVFKDFSEINRFIKVKDTFCPSPEHEKVYDKLKPLFDESYRCLESLYEKLKIGE